MKVFVETACPANGRIGVVGIAFASTSTMPSIKIQGPSRPGAGHAVSERDSISAMGVRRQGSCHLLDNLTQQRRRQIGIPT